MIIPAECQNEKRDSRIAVEERGKKAVFVNGEKRKYLLTRVDGCVIKNATAADWILTAAKVGDVIVELKGRNVQHALEQIMATAKFWTDNGLRQGKIAALIVCSQHPQVTTKSQRAQNDFKRKYKGKLQIKCKVWESTFASMLGE